MPTDHRKVDATDRRILDILVRDGRATLQSIAERVGLRRPSVHERVRRLEAAGVIRGYHAELDPEASEAGLLAFVLLQAEMGARGKDCLACCEGIAKALKKHREVLEVHTVAGTDDALVKVRVRDIRSLERLVMREITGAPGVRRAQTLIVMSTHFERPVSVG